VKRRWLAGGYPGGKAVTFQAQLVNFAANQQHRIKGTVGRMTFLAAIGSSRWMFENKRPPLVYVAADTSELRDDLETSHRPFRIGMRAMAIHTRHPSLQDRMMVRLTELRLC
jgi:hypothetical protein